MFAIIPIDRIHPNPEQPRKNFPIGELRGLADSIKIHGVIQPIAVEQLGDDYVLHDGERRVRACRMAGVKTIPAMIQAGEDTTSLDRLERALATSIQRAGLNAIEEARAFSRLVNEFGMTQNKVALRMGRTPAYVTQRLLLLRLDVPIQELIAAGRMSADPVLARDLLRIPNPKDRIDLAERLADDDATIHEARRAAKDMAAIDGHNPGKPAAQLVDGSGHALPIMQRVREKQKRSSISANDWDMFSQAGMVPPWPAVKAAADATCQACALREIASRDVCRECPGVDMLTRLIDSASLDPRGANNVVTRRLYSDRGLPHEKNSPIRARK